MSNLDKFAKCLTTFTVKEIQENCKICGWMDLKTLNNQTTIPNQ